MISANPYLHFMGNTAEAMNFYKSIFGGEFITFARFKDVPGGEKMSPEEQEMIIHASLPLGKTVLMATDMLESMEHKIIEGNNFHICINTESEDEADKLFEKLARDGVIEMAMNKTFWGAYFGMCRDRFNVRWMISYSKI
jgi:PhnB protein